jgi:lysophospholipase L1-like esterase
MKCVLVGSSHASLLTPHLRKFSEKYNIQVNSLTKPGATYEQLIFPDSKDLCESDILILIPIGNNIFEKNTHQIARNAKGKTIHLKRFAPIQESNLKELFIDLHQKLDKYVCKKFILDSFYKYVSCCTKHQKEFPLLIKHQKKCNSLLKEYFRTTNVTVLNHLSLFEQPWKARGSLNYYKKHMLDSVHFSKRTYEKMAEKIVQSIMVNK